MANRYQNGVPTPAGKSLVLYPTNAKDIPSGGSHVLCGPDLQKDLLNTVKSECANREDPKCLDAVIKCCGKDLASAAEGNFLQSRVVAAASAFAALVAAVFIGLYQRLEANEPTPVDIHLPPPLLSQLDSASTASEIIFKTADNDPSPISAKITATSSGSGPLKTLTADGNGHHKGDIELAAPNKDVADKINNFFKQGACQAPKSKRGMELDKRVDSHIQDCLRTAYTNILNALGADQPLHDLAAPAVRVVQGFPLPTFDNQDYAAVFTQALVIGANTLPNIIHDIANNELILTSTFVYMLATANIQNKLMEDSKIVLAQEQFVKWDEEFKPTCPAKGDKEFPKCNLPICQGKDGLCTVSPLKPCPCDGGNSKCETDYKKFVSRTPNIYPVCTENLIISQPECSKCGGNFQKCTTGDRKNCDCVEDRFRWFVNPIDPPDWLETQYKIWQSVGPNTFGLDTQGTDPKCEDNTSEIQYKLFNDGNGNGLYNNFCAAVSKDPKRDLIQLVDPAGNVVPHKRKRSLASKRTPPKDPAAVIGYTFDLEWTGGDGSCDSDCKKSFDTITVAPSCGKLGGEHNYMAMSGSLNTGCGIYSYKILKAVDWVPQAGPIRCNQAPADFNNAKDSNGKVSKCWYDITDKSVGSAVDNFNHQLPSNVVDSKMHGFQWGYTVWQPNENGMTYISNVMWVPGCGDYKTMCLNNPQGKLGDATACPNQPSHQGYSISVSDILTNVYKYCQLLPSLTTNMCERMTADTFGIQVKAVTRG